MADEHIIHRNARQAVRHGLLGRCPQCGSGRLFDGYLSVAARCSECGEPLGEYRAADGPAFFTISIVGVLLVPILGFSFIAFRPDPLTLLLTITITVTVLTLVLLRFVKGAWIGFLWSQQERDLGA